MNKRLLTVSALGALLAFGAVACSGDDSEQLNGWAKSVCDAAQDPTAKSRAALADSTKVIPGEAPADLQKRLSAGLATLGASSQQLADAVDKAGAPKVDDGAKLQQDAVGELRQAAQGYQEAQKKLDGLPTADQAKFADGLRSVGDQVQQLSQQSTQAMQKLQSGVLGDAIKKQPGCKAGAPAASGAGTGADASAGAGASQSAAPSGGATPAASGSAKPSASASASG
ncbi:small secreted protein [Kitasatospora sp. NPDC048365]|uniref:small secreted protein n=1 Tax=Kitasatospora sp. NPDC048365 TaxID=3364050 RepID=UPI003721602E